MKCYIIFGGFLLKWQLINIIKPFRMRLPKIIEQKKGIVKKVEKCVRAVITDKIDFQKKICTALFPILYNIQPRRLKDHLEKFSSDVESKL